MRFLNNAATWIAALSVAAGSACILAFLYGDHLRSYALTAAQAAAVIGGVSLLVSVLAVNFPMLHRAGLAMESQGPFGYGTTCWYRRREVLMERLNIDEPRLCSQYIIPCTCWSFCANSDGIGSVGAGEAPAAQKSVPPSSPLAAVNGLRVVHRREMDDCQYRFASPLARPASRSH